MKAFESFLAPKLEEYIEHRLSLGYTNRNLRSILRPFDSYTKENADDWDFFQPKIFIEFRKKLKGEASTVNGVLSGVRNSIDEIRNRLGHRSISGTMVYLHLDLSRPREMQKEMNEYTQSILSQDPKIEELIDWENKEKTLNWLDSL